VDRAVLIADDDVPLLKLLKTIVSRKHPFDVVTCRDGEEAIRALTIRHFDVVLLDLMMPRRNGFDVIAFLQQHRPAQLRVVLVLTAATDHFAARLDPSIVHGVIAKPFDCEALIALIQNIVDGVAPRLAS
jgi:DNA-binding response OmpR family regulator